MVTKTGTSGNDRLIGGVGPDDLQGLAGDDILDGRAGPDSMSGGSGNDIYYVDDIGDLVIERADEGIDTIRSTINFTCSANVEKLYLIGPNALEGYGNALANTIFGNQYANVIDGGAGADIMKGGSGNDTYYVDNAKDRAVELAGEGTDRVIASVSFILGTNVENLELAAGLAINGTGNDLNNILTGNGMDNVLDGKGGSDTLVGGLGNDTYIVDQAGDLVTELLGEGTDTIRASCSFTLAANTENLYLLGSSALAGTGNELANKIFGNEYANVIDGRGGADMMKGGAGDDTYYVDNANDRAVELAAGGTDKVIASVSFSLGANIENLELAGTAAISATGNDLGNALTGNSAANFLDGKAGADTMAGLGGNDTYVVDNVGDVVVEGAFGGYDLVKSSVTYTLGANVEGLTLTGTAAIDGTGNALSNDLVGNSAANTLSGGDGNDYINGGAGADTMIGGAGSDHYIVDNVNDVIVETGSDAESVKATVSYTLPARVEALFAADFLSTNAIDLTGNTGDNYLVGSQGANVIAGGSGNDWLLGYGGADTLKGDAGDDWLIGGGTGDVMTGGTGQDKFVFASQAELGVPVSQSVTDFVSGTDKIVLVSDALFGFWMFGAPSPEMFYEGTAAHDADDRFIYDKATGNLYFDPDGSGKLAKQLLGSLGAGTTFVATDIELTTSNDMAMRLAPLDQTYHF
ncbi:calcium-binding protein [Novosphingobium cyanobacteriorum]|uniref:Calcium-binding protein n=1 Tax=Novosphingobium cyanobacteriorum TaxID=3024215 RepID=A0ABT6CFB2_9SPHN|nr:hypothetical protein [Novosphingobium cyanobacteriorum]MDF8332605.1 hypothetical protein [Novosphingobium cyanobacteriorum]